MAAQHTSEKDKAMELAEESREKDWKYPSFTAELFRGAFRWDLMHPYPVQDPDDKRAGDAYLEVLKRTLEEHVDPIAIDADGEMPREAIDKLAEIGAFGMKIPKEYGGLGLSQTNYSRMLHLIGSFCGNTGSWLSAHQSIGVPQPLKIFGTEEQKKKYLPRLAKGAISAFALTEPGVGSDPARMETTATPSEDGTYYLLNGEKLWCTNGVAADILVVMAKTPPKLVRGKERQQVTAFIVEKDMPGFEVVHRCQFMGLRGLGNGKLRFTNVKVPAGNIIGQPGEGLKIALTTLNAGRLGIPASCAGTGKAIMVMAEKWVNERVQWGSPIGKHQEIAKKVASIAADTFAMDSTVWFACALEDSRKADIRLEAAIAKYFCTETLWRMIDDWIQIRGGRGYENERSLYERGEEPMAGERMQRDARVLRILEGSTEIMRLIMAREALDTHFRLIMPLAMPHLAGKSESKASLIMKAAKFYVSWYPRMWLPGGARLECAHLTGSNRAHLAFVHKTCKRLARTIFHTMVKYQKRLETEQLLLANLVDIGVDLFVMAVCLARAEQIDASGSVTGESPQKLADLFCRNARVRIAANFAALKKNHNRLYDAVTADFMAGKYRWMINDVFTEYPKNWRDWNRPSPEAASSAEEALHIT